MHVQQHAAISHLALDMVASQGALHGYRMIMTFRVPEEVRASMLKEACVGTFSVMLPEPAPSRQSLWARLQPGYCRCRRRRAGRLLRHAA